MHVRLVVTGEWLLHVFRFCNSVKVKEICQILMTISSFAAALVNYVVRSCIVV